MYSTQYTNTINIIKYQYKYNKISKRLNVSLAVYTAADLDAQL